MSVSFDNSLTHGANLKTDLMVNNIIRKHCELKILFYQIPMKKDLHTKSYIASIKPILSDS
jgi:hypothetical protein